MTTTRQLDRDIAEFLADRTRGRSHATRKFKAARQPEYETKTSEDHPGESPPMQYELDVGRAHEGHKPLYWKKLLAAHKKEMARGGGGNALQLDLWIMHAPDGHTPFTRVDWPDPLDVRSAEKFARELVEDGGAEISYVNARASRGHGGKSRAPVWTIAKFAREPAS